MFNFEDSAGHEIIFGVGRKVQVICFILSVILLLANISKLTLYFVSLVIILSCQFENLKQGGYIHRVQISSYVFCDLMTFVSTTNAQCSCPVLPTMSYKFAVDST